MNREASISCPLVIQILISIDLAELAVQELFALRMVPMYPHIPCEVGEVQLRVADCVTDGKQECRWIATGAEKERQALEDIVIRGVKKAAT